MEVGQRVRLNRIGKACCTQGPIRMFPKNHVFRGTIVDIMEHSEKLEETRYLIHMDDEGFNCGYGKGFNVLYHYMIEPL